MSTSMEYRLGYAAGEAKGYVQGETQGYLAGYAKAVHDFRAAMKKEDEERDEENKQRFLDGKREMLNIIQEWIDDQSRDLEEDEDEEEDEEECALCAESVPCPPWQEVTVTATPMFPMDELKARLSREAAEYAWISPEDYAKIRQSATEVLGRFFGTFDPKKQS